VCLYDTRFSIRCIWKRSLQPLVELIVTLLLRLHLLILIVAVVRLGAGFLLRGSLTLPTALGLLGRRLSIVRSSLGRVTTLARSGLLRRWLTIRLGVLSLRGAALFVVRYVNDSVRCLHGMSHCRNVSGHLRNLGRWVNVALPLAMIFALMARQALAAERGLPMPHASASLS